jgi:hypothetical protein
MAQRRAALVGMRAAAGRPSSTLEGDFRAACRELPEPSVLELGTLQAVPGVSTLHRDWVPHAAEYLGTDIQAGPDVDVVADAHRLSQVTGTERFDVILSASTFEHFKYPWLAAHEVLRTLRVGGLLFVQTHQTFPLHGYPADFFRFSREALAALFGTRMGFEVRATHYDFPARVYARRVHDTQLHPAFLNVTLWGRKHAPTPDEYRFDLD